MVDAFSKWPEVKIVSSTMTQKTITVLNEIFATHGFPRVLVSDNGPQLTSSEFEEFLQQNNITHYKSPSYHPSLNGVGWEHGQKCQEPFEDLPNSKSNISCSVSAFLRTYRNVPHTVTNKSPADLIAMWPGMRKPGLCTQNTPLHIMVHISFTVWDSKAALHFLWNAA